jgi:hypothetical protein
MVPRNLAATIASLIAIAALASATGPRGAADGGAFTVSVESPAVKVGQPAAIVATISARDGYRITESYRHRIVNIASIDDGVEISRKVVRGAMKDGTVVFRVDVLPRTAGTHIVAGVFRFSINNGSQLDIKAAPFEATVVATE